MADFDPKAYLKKFDPKAYLATKTAAEAGAEPDSPLGRALAANPADVVPVNDPQEGFLGNFTRQGQRFMTPEEAGADMKANLNLGGQQILRSFLAGGGPFLDELAGVKAVGGAGLDTLKKAAGGDFEARNPLDVYRGARDIERRETKQATSSAPEAAFLGQLAATLPVGAAGGGMGLGGRLLSQAGANAVAMGENELGASDIDATKGGSSDLAKQVLQSMMTGGAIGAAGELGASGLGAGARYLGGKAGGALEALSAQIARQREKAVNSARGSLGGIIAGQNNIADALLDITRNPGNYSLETATKAFDALNSPEGKTLLSRSAENNIGKLGDALAREQPARDAFQEAIAAAKPDAVAEEVARRSDPANVLADVGGKAATSLGQRALLGGIGALGGYALGHETGAGLGAGLGYMAPGALQFMRNTVKSPANQAAVFGLGQTALNDASGAFRSSVAPVVDTAVSQSGDRNVGYESLISKWLKPGAPQSLVQEAQSRVDADARKNLVNATNGAAPQE